MLVQAHFMRKGLSVTAAAADAAKKSADAATDAIAHAKSTSEKTERAIVVVDSIATNTEKLEDYTIVTFTVKNFGRTIAGDVELTGKFSGVAGWPMDAMPKAMIAPQGTNSWDTRSIGNWIGKDLIHKINNDISPLQCTIEVTYADAFGSTHTYHCEGKYHPGLRQFIVVGSTSD
jgi:hypothetical protein